MNSKQFKKDMLFFSEGENCIDVYGFENGEIGDLTIKRKKNKICVVREPNYFDSDFLNEIHVTIDELKQLIVLMEQFATNQNKGE